MSRNSVKSTTQDFSKAVHANVPRSIFYRPSGLKTTFNAGDLVPIYIDEILPGDTYKMKIQHVARLITPLVPVMDNIQLEIFAFFVPNRIVWDNWAALNGENEDSAWTPSSTPAGVPSFGAGVTQSEKKLGDYYGLPPGIITTNHDINVLPFRGYLKIWNEWFRNQNLQAPYVVSTDDSAYAGGGSSSALEGNMNSALLKVNKPFDYFTSCLPEPQKGESQLIPIELNELIPVISQAAETTSGHTQGVKWRRVSGGALGTNQSLVTDSTGQTGEGGSVSNPSQLLYASNLWADGSGLTINGTTINDLRTAFQIQKLYERDARGGTRYVEMLKSHFGVDAGDYRLQRPEYLGHTKSMININQVAQTGETGTTPQGNLAAYGHSQGDDFLFNKSFVEHGFVHIFAVARHKKTYSQGLEKFWSRKDRLDYYMPALAHISEQPVYQKEIYALAANSETVFGYNEAWSDYRYKPSRITGEMRASATNSFDIWHYGDEYSTAPYLSDAWMEDNSEDNLKRSLAIQTVDQIKMDVRFDLTATGPIPVNSIPGYIDHF